MLEFLINLWVEITTPFLKKKILRKYREEQAQEIMEKYLKEDKTCIGVYDKKGHIKEIRKLEVK